MSSLISKITIGQWSDAALYLLGLVMLTLGGNLACRLALWLSNIKLPPDVPAVSALVPSPPLPANTATGTPKAADLSALPPSAPPPQPAPTPPATTARAGRMIGSLERLLILIGIAAGAWEIIAAVIAVKSVARFKELDDRLRAEYFLVGSLTSIAWAILVTFVLLRFDRTLGLHLADLLPVKTK